MVVIGLMSGTSADGIDAAVVEISGAPPRLRWRMLAHVATPHSAERQREILACCDPRSATVDRVCALNAALGRDFGQAALAAAAPSFMARMAPGIPEAGLGSHRLRPGVVRVAAQLEGVSPVRHQSVLPDQGFMGLAEIADHTARIRDAVNLPVEYDHFLNFFRG